MALRSIQTTTGTVAPGDLGRTLVHEHVLVGYPGWELDARAPRFKRAEAMARAVDQMHELKGHGVGTFLDPCPMDLGRDAVFLAELAQKSGMQIICATGMYFEAEGNKGLRRRPSRGQRSRRMRTMTSRRMGRRSRRRSRGIFLNEDEGEAAAAAAIKFVFCAIHCCDAPVVNFVSLTQISTGLTAQGYVYASP